MRPRLVLDTNTILALWMFRDPRLALLRGWIEGGACTLASREDALTELRHVLAYSRFGLGEDAQHALLADYRNQVEVLPEMAEGETRALPVCRDGDDQKFLEIAFDAGASHLLTRDKLLLRAGRHRLLRGRYRVMTPERFSAETLAPAAAPER
ncbi:putative toxin-antitoxin system toxin component, PIN family [Thauera butanivorans]|uniref:putative toxin-antitoxin system toxin component, PIN family n=1 Tax=Thauera butanivorans TaxID=86174 RepID=UPI000B496BB0|nr:putative toxin-antitoxin system toxin component, PIN family [Thauera butanivorans]